MTRMPCLIESTSHRNVSEPWRKRLIEARADFIEKTIPAFLEFCRVVYAFKRACGPTSGGTTFTQDGCAWLGVKPASLHKWAAVGMRADELSRASGKLPASQDAIARLAALDDRKFAKAMDCVDSHMSGAEVAAVIKEIDPPPVRSAPAKPKPYNRFLEDCGALREIELTSTERFQICRRAADTLVHFVGTLPEKDRAVVLELLGKA